MKAKKKSFLLLFSSSELNRSALNARVRNRRARARTRTHFNQAKKALFVCALLLLLLASVITAKRKKLAQFKSQQKKNACLNACAMYSNFNTAASISTYATVTAVHCPHARTTCIA